MLLSVHKYLKQTVSVFCQESFRLQVCHDVTGWQIDCIIASYLTRGDTTPGFFS